MISHLAILLFCTWLSFGYGLQTIGQIVDQRWSFVDPGRAHILVACIALYWVRHAITLFYLLERKVDWGEVIGLLVFFALFEIILLLIGG